MCIFVAEFSISYDMPTIDSRIDLQRQLPLVAVRRIHFFAIDTINKIFEHIDRLGIRRTDALRSSIKATVHTNAGGNDALVQFFYLHYGDCVEQAVGKYYGVDADLGDKRGIRSENIKAPEIQGVGYGKMRGSFSGVPDNARREETHRPRPFLRSEIRRQVDRTSFKLMEEAGILIDIHMASLIGDEVGGEIAQLLKNPFAGQNGTQIEYDDSLADARDKTVKTPI